MGGLNEKTQISNYVQKKYQSIYFWTATMYISIRMLTSKISLKEYDIFVDN